MATAAYFDCCGPMNALTKETMGVYLIVYKEKNLNYI
jgi:hypothetical protein